MVGSEFCRASVWPDPHLLSVGCVSSSYRPTSSLGGHWREVSDQAVFGDLPYILAAALLSKLVRIVLIMVENEDPPPARKGQEGLY